ncbi:MAG: LLM class flavin-dependent oxidoreductase [Ilumatobacteraceae bacterium]
MKFGLMYEMQAPEPHTPATDHDLYNRVLDQVELADQLGYDYAWAVEHHFLPEFARCPAPEVLFGAMSQRTKRIRIGHGVVLLPPEYNHPIRVAERIATLDVLTNGRVEFGTGRSSTLIEMNGFGVDPETTKEVWEEAVSIIPRMMMEDPFECNGKFFKVPPRTIVPKVVQKPHPPMWVGCTQPASFEGAGEKGLGALCFNIGAPEKLKERIDTYRAAAERAKPAGGVVNNQVAGFTIVHCAETDEEAVENAAHHAMWFVQQSQKLYQPWLDPEVHVPDSYKHMLSSEMSTRMMKTVDEFISEGTLCIGSPETVINNIKRYEAIGLDQVLCLMQFGRLEHEKTMKSMRLVAEKVMPAFA